MFHHVARQMFRQRPTFGFAPRALDLGLNRGRLGFRLRRPLRAASSSAACSASRLSSNVRKAVTLFGSARESSGDGMDESSLIDSRCARFFLTTLRFFHPASSGRQLRAGIRQSMPSSNIDNCAGVRQTAPSFA